MVLLDTASPRHEAVGEAGRLAQQQSSTVELYDCGMGQCLAPGWAEDAGLYGQYLALLHERRLEDLERLARPLRSCGIAVTTVAEQHAPLAEAIIEHIAQAMPDVIVKDRASQRADSAGWQVQTDSILERHARCPVVLVGEVREGENSILRVKLQEDCP
jgi:hypothetical protein